MLLRTLAFLVLVFIAFPVSAEERIKPYCQIYMETLEKVAHDQRRGYQDYSDVMVGHDRLREDAAFIFSQPESFDFEGWINERYQTCWEQIPFGPDSGERLVVSAGSRLIYAIRNAVELTERLQVAKAQSEESVSDSRSRADRALSEVHDLFPQYVNILKNEHEKINRYSDSVFDSNHVQLLREQTATIETELKKLYEMTSNRNIDDYKIRYTQFIMDASGRNAKRFEDLQL